MRSPWLLTANVRGTTRARPDKRRMRAESKCDPVGSETRKGTARASRARASCPHRAERAAAYSSPPGGGQLVSAFIAGHGTLSGVSPVLAAEVVQKLGQGHHLLLSTCALSTCASVTYCVSGASSTEESTTRLLATASCDPSRGVPLDAVAERPTNDVKRHQRWVGCASETVSRRLDMSSRLRTESTDGTEGTRYNADPDDPASID